MSEHHQEREDLKKVLDVIRDCLTATQKAEGLTACVADLLVEYAGPPSKNGQRDGSGKKLRRIADIVRMEFGFDCGFSDFSYLRALRRTAHKFPPGRRPPDVAFSWLIAAGDPKTLEEAREQAKKEGVPCSTRYIEKFRESGKHHGDEEKGDRGSDEDQGDHGSDDDQDDHGSGDQGDHGSDDDQDDHGSGDDQDDHGSDDDQGDHGSDEDKDDLDAKDLVLRKDLERLFAVTINHCRKFTERLDEPAWSTKDRRALIVKAEHAGTAIVKLVQKLEKKSEVPVSEAAE
jgi:hypothetical protein